MNALLKTQINDKISLTNKLNELVNTSRKNIDNKMRLITDLLLSLKEENEQIITKSKN
jgi:hypothetical protein